MKLRFSHKSRGQSLVETALILPLLLLIAVVTFDMGRGVYYYSVIYNAAREGARYGIIHPDDINGIKAAVEDLAIGVNLDITDPHQIVVIPNPPNPNIATIQVQINYEFELVTPIAKWFTHCSCGQIELHSSSTMFVER